MSDNKPTINITRGKKKREPKAETPSSGSSSLIPGPMDVATGLATGARNLFLAGLGALSVAEEAGTQVFNMLVAEGKSWEQARAERTRQAANTMKRMREEGAGAVASVESRVRNEVDQVLERVGVPTKDDMTSLRKEVNDLSEKVDRLAEALDK